MSDQRRCPSCDRVASTDTPFCAYCGNRIDERRCPSCDGVVGDDASFCVHCGNSVDNNLPEPEPTAEELQAPEPQRITETEEPEAEEPQADDTKIGRGKRFLRGCGIILAVIVGGFILLMIVAVIVGEDADDDGGSRPVRSSTPRPIPLCQRDAEREYMATLRNNVALITEQSDELWESLTRMSKDPYLISSPSWKYEVGTNLGFMLYGASEILELDSPRSLQSLSRAAERMAREVEAAVALHTSALDNLDADRMNDGTQRISKATTYMQEMTDVTRRLCGS